MQSATAQYGTHAGDPAQPVQHSVMTAISLGRFLRGVAIPSDFGSIFTTAVDMPRIMTQSEPRPHSEIGANFRGLSPGASPRLSASSVFSGVDFPRSPQRSSLRVSAPPRQIRGFVGSTSAGLGSEPSVQQLETERDVRLIELGNRTSRSEEHTSELQS